MADLKLDSVSELRDTTAIKQYQVMTERFGIPEAQALAAVAATTRDRCRSPLQWSSAPNAGFCPPGVQPWLPVHPNHATGVTVADQVGDPTSLLSFYRRMLALRLSMPALFAGDYQVLDVPSEHVLAFLRHDAGSKQICLVALNFSVTAQQVPFDPGARQARLRFASTDRHDLPGERHTLTLSPFEVVVVELV
jgi:alpha-glucosidase